MRLTPSFQIAAVAALGAMCAATADVLINAAASGVLKAAGILVRANAPGALATPFCWVLFVALGPLSAAYFRPLTRRSAFALAFGLAAVFSILVPGGR